MGKLTNCHAIIMGVLQPLKYILKKKRISSVTPAGVKGVERIERQQQVHLWHCSLESQRACFRCTVMIVFLAQFSYFLHQDDSFQVVAKQEAKEAIDTRGEEAAAAEGSVMSLLSGAFCEANYLSLLRRERSRS